MHFYYLYLQKGFNIYIILYSDSKSLYKVDKALLNKRVLKDIEKLSPHHQTSSLEAFHSVILSFVPKDVVFPFLGMLCR